MVHLQHLVRWSSAVLLVASLARAEDPTGATATPAQPPQPATEANSTPASPALPQASTDALGAPCPCAPRVEEHDQVRGGVPVDADTGPSDVKMNQSYLEEMVVVGRATKMARKNLPNTVATVKAEDLARCPAQTVEAALQGKIVGANIQSNSGAPAGRMQIKLRGTSTFGVHREPLYVVDGVIISDMGTADSWLMPTRRY